MIEKLKQLKSNYEELNTQMTDPSIMSDMDNYKKVTRRLKELEPIVKAFEKYDKILADIAGNKELINDSNTDSDLKEMAEMELADLSEQENKLQEDLKIMLVPKDPNDSSNAIVEIRAGTGGDEAGIFAGDLYRMYTKYCMARNWKYEIMDINESEKGGYKEIVFTVSGDEVYGSLKYESGVHRVQRVPDTETQGRVHTSAATVAVLLETDDIEIEINENDLRIDVYRSSGNGGQSVNTTDSAVRITHNPTGIVVTCQDEKSQLKNKIKAMKHLKARIYDIELSKQQEAMRSERQDLVGTGDRSAKIRTYNFPQGRCTDHRINFTSYNLEKVMNGHLEEFTEQLQLADRMAKMTEA